MPATWSLRDFFRDRGISSASDVRKFVEERTGPLFSAQEIRDLLKGMHEPKLFISFDVPYIESRRED